MPYIDEAFIQDLRRRLEDAEPSSGQHVPLPATGPAEPERGCSYGFGAGSSRGACDSAYTALRTSPSQELDEEAFEAYKKIQRLVSVSERSTKGLRERLAKDGFSPEAIEDALARAVSYSIVDDRRYAEAYVRTKLAAGKGRRGIEAELRDLGIEPDEIEGWAEGEEDEVTRALALIEKRPPTAKNKRDAAYRRLVSKGYSSSAAQSAARMWSESL